MGLKASLFIAFVVGIIVIGVFLMYRSDSTGLYIETP